MIDLTTLGNTTGSAASNDVAAKNAASATAIDGTPYNAAKVDNDWGWQQALLEYAGLTANGVTETKTASQLLDALKVTMSPPGTIVMGGWNDDPVTLGYRLLLLDGSGILVANYPDLVSACYVGDANNSAAAAAGGGYYKATDAAGTTPNISGTYFILPDTRGQTVRGLDAVGSVDPDGASRYLGDIQGFALETHNHLVVQNFSYPSQNILGASLIEEGTITPTDFVGLRENVSSGTVSASEFEIGEDMTSHSASAIDPKGVVDEDETRMTNFSVQFAIRY